MAAITYGNVAVDGLGFGIPQAEVDLLVQSLSRMATSSEAEVSGEQGDIMAHAAFGFYADINIQGYAYGTGGLGSAGIGDAFVLVNLFNGNGVSGGTTIVKSINVEYTNKDFAKLTAVLRQFPMI